MYVKLSRALYGTIEAAKIWYDTLSSKLRKEGFTQNAYDNCVFNKEYNNNQLTVLLHVDDLKVACIDRRGIEYVVDMLNREYTKANVYEGSKLDYLGMIFNYGLPGEVSIDMSKMVLEFLNELEVPEEARRDTPAASHLLDISDNAALLDESNKKLFHSLVAKALYMAKIARPRILLPVSFLTTRVHKPDINDLKK